MWLYGCVRDIYMKCMCLTCNTWELRKLLVAAWDMTNYLAKKGTNLYSDIVDNHCNDFRKEKMCKEGSLGPWITPSSRTFSIQNKTSHGKLATDKYIAPTEYLFTV